MMSEQTNMFEELARQNGSTLWSAREFMLVLGYDSWDDFQKLVRKTMGIYLQSEWVEAEKEFRYFEVEEGDYTLEDYKLSRFACYVLAMNGETSHPEVIQAQSFFAKTVESFQDTLTPNDIERFGIRGQLKEAFKDLNKTFTKQSGTNYALFNQAGIVGMYNQPNWKLAKARGVQGNKLYERMSRTELAANLFRVTQTEERIKSQAIRGQTNLESAHKDVGRAVRNMVKENVGIFPEQLPQAEQPVPKIESNLKKTQRKFQKMDDTEA